MKARCVDIDAVLGVLKKCITSKSPAQRDMINHAIYEISRLPTINVDPDLTFDAVEVAKLQCLMQELNEYRNTRLNPNEVVELQLENKRLHMENFWLTQRRDAE